MKKYIQRLLILILSVFSIKGSAQNKLFIPDTLNGPDYDLTMHEDSVAFFPGKLSHTYAFNANHYLGPTLIFNKGTAVSIMVYNALKDTTTVHWHGIHVPAKWDGGPFSPILPGATWNPQFTIMDDAATYWYHPHLHMKTAEQAIKGAAGLIIVRDPVESALSLPRRYGLDDFPIIVQCQQYDQNNQAMPKGMEDSTLLINGTRNAYLNAPAQMVRLRLLNASGERTMNFGFTDNLLFHQIASDGGLLDTPYETTRVRLSPGERAEIVLNLTGMNAKSLYLICYGSELPIGIQGGPTMPMPKGSPPMDSPLNGIDYNVLRINVTTQTASPVTSLPSSLTVNKVYAESKATTLRTIRFTADSQMVMDGPFYFNDSSFDMMRVDYTIPVNNIEVWKLVNETMVAHPFHLHDVQFFILDRNGQVPDKAESGRKDVVLVPPGDSVRFITQFIDYTDSVIPYMFHCHILMHEDDGMMGQFLVVPRMTGVSDLSPSSAIQLFPNPASSKVTILINNKCLNGEIRFMNVLGELVLIEKVSIIQRSQAEVDISGLKTGVYFVEFNSEGFLFRQKLVKQ